MITFANKMGIVLHAMPCPFLFSMGNAAVMLRTRLVFIGVLALAICGLLERPSPGQWRGRSRSYSPPSQDIDPGVILRRLDANGDGSLSRDEIPDRARPIVERAAQTAKLDLNQPVPIDQLVTAIRESRGKSSSGNDSSSGKSRSSSGEGAELVPGFGADPELPEVPGFGAVNDSGPVSGGNLKDHYENRVIEYVDRIFYRYDKNRNDFLDNEEWKDVEWRSDPKESDTNKDGRLSKAEFCERMVKRWNWGRKKGRSSASATSGTPARFGTSGGDSSKKSSGGSRDSSGKIREYAKSLMKQYDKNKDGVLQKDEWSQMRGNYKEADSNGDGTLTLDEITAKLSSYGSGSSSSKGGSSRSGSSPSRSYGPGSRTTSGKDVYRFKSPTERLPRGLPDWFDRCDTNGDGQVAMSEYSATWSDSKADEFRRYDLNGDGFATPEECLEAERDD